MKKLTSLIVFIVLINYAYAQIKINSSGNVGIGTTSPLEQFQIGDRWTFHNGGTKIIGYNFTYNSGDRRILLGKSACFRMDQVAIKFGFGGTGIAGSLINWTYPINITNTLTCINTDLEIDGLAYCSDGLWLRAFDKSKDNITPITKAKDMIINISGNYFLTPSNKANASLITNKRTYGLIAQELKAVIPDLVIERDDSTKQLSINYIGLIPILIEAFKEQNETIDSLKRIIHNLEIGNPTSILYFDKSSLSKSRAYLDQNMPNPFNQITTISYYIPDNAKSGRINIYNMNGTQIKSIPIITFGNGSIVLNGSELQPGMYIYNLIVDGNEISSKRMILTN